MIQSDAQDRMPAAELSRVKSSLRSAGHSRAAPAPVRTGRAPGRNSTYSKRSSSARPLQCRPSPRLQPHRRPPTANTTASARRCDARTVRLPCTSKSPWGSAPNPTSMSPHPRGVKTRPCNDAPQGDPDAAPVQQRPSYPHLAAGRVDTGRGIAPGPVPRPTRPSTRTPTKAPALRIGRYRVLTAACPRAC